MDRSVPVYLGNKGNLNLLRCINLIMFLGNPGRLLLYQHIGSIGKHPAFSPVIILAAALARMNRCHVPVCVMSLGIPL